MEPLAPSRYQVRFTASAELREKLERLQALMRYSVPDGDLARIIDIAVTEKLQRVEAKRFGKAKAPRSDLAETDTTASSRHIPATVRRLVHGRTAVAAPTGTSTGADATSATTSSFTTSDPSPAGATTVPPT